VTNAGPRRFDLGDFTFESGEVLPGAFIVFVTLGALNADGTNAVLAPSWYGSDWHGYDFLIGPGKALDPARDFIILTEMFGSGGSSSPSNTPAPFDRSRFPRVAVRDNVEAVCQRDPNNLICQARAWQRHDVGSTPGFGDDVESALRSIDVPVLSMPSETDLYFPVEDAAFERQFIRHVTFRPIPSLWGHRAGGGRNPADNDFLNAQIREFLV
jgi:homoserine acetyltransferase